MNTAHLRWVRPAWRAVAATAIVAYLAWWLWLLWRRQPDHVGRDFFPFYFAAQAMRAGYSPYEPFITQRMAEVAPATKNMGFAYPLPALLGLWPLFWWSLPTAVALWTMLGSAASCLAAWLRDDARHRLKAALLPFVFWPFFQAVQSKQGTLIWFALCVLLLLAMQRRWSWLAAYCIAMLPGKPQTGLVFALYGVWWAWRHDRRTLGWLAAWTLLIWGGSFARLPDWPQQCLAIVRRYNDFNYTTTLWPWGLLLLAATWKLPLYARLATLQTVLFPVTNIYSALPLLLAWVAIGGPLAYAGAAISMLPLAFDGPNTPVTLWAFVLSPLLLCAVWHSWYAAWRSWYTAWRSRRAR